MAQDPIADRTFRPVVQEPARGALAEAWNATFIGRYVKSHHIGRTGLVAAAIVVAFLFFAVGAALRLLVGPISLAPFSGQISEALDRALPGIKVRYDQAAVQWSRSEGRVNLVVLGARVFDSRGRIIAQAPQADIDLAAAPFLKGDLVVKRITLVGVQLTLVRALDGTLRLGVERDLAQSDVIRKLMDAISKSQPGASTLEAFAVRDARVAFMDEGTHLFLVAPRTNLRLSDMGANLAASLDADVEVSGAPAHVTVDLTLPPGKAPVGGRIQVKHLDVAALGRDAKTFAFLTPLALTADFDSSFALQGQSLLEARFALTASGRAGIAGIRAPVDIRGLHLDGSYDRSAQRVTFDNATLDSDALRTRATGALDIVSDNNGVSRLGFSVTATQSSLALPATFPQPLLFPSIVIKGSYLPDLHELDLDGLNTSGGALVLDAKGKLVLLDNQSPALDLSGHLAQLRVRDLLHYWPKGIGQGAHDWVDANIFSGSIGPLAFETHFAAGQLDAPQIPDAALLLTFPIVDAEVNYLRGLTHLTGVNGSAQLTGSTFTVDVRSGHIGPLVLTAGRGVIGDLNTPGAPADVSAHVEGTMTNVLKLVDQKPLGYPTRFGIDPMAAAGKAGVDLKFHIPMRKNLSVDAIALDIKAAVSGFGMPLGKNTRLSDGAVNFEIDNARLHAFGNALLGATRLSLDWVEDFHAPGPVTTKIAAKGIFDQAARDALGLKTGDFLKGPIGVTANLLGRRGQLSSADMDLDLTPATIEVDIAGIAKPAGMPATGHATLDLGSHNAIQTANLSVASQPLQASMVIGFDQKGALTSFNAPSVRAGPANDFSLNVTRGPNGLDILIRGHSLDGTQLAGKASTPSTAASGGAGKPGAKSDSLLDGPFHIDARLDRLVLRNGLEVTPLALDVSGISDRPSAMSLSGSVGKASITGSIVAAGNDRHLKIATTDAATLAKGLLGFSSIKGGTLNLDVTLHGLANAPPTNGPSEYDGVAVLKDFRLMNQPFLARAFTAGSLLGFANLMQNNGIEVDELKIPFSAKNGVLAIHDARANGPSIGVSAEGYLDRPKNVVELKGTIVPLYGLNSLLGVIPVVGDLLVSKPGEGIIGLSYTLSGSADQPQVSINPLSMVTPGILRRIFEGKMPQAANAPSNAKPQTLPDMPPVDPAKP